MENHFHIVDIQNSMDIFMKLELAFGDEEERSSSVFLHAVHISKCKPLWIGAGRGESTFSKEP